MKNVYKTTMMIDFYGQLLTDRQYEILDLHYNNDYSLAEIAEHLGISRQGVFDNIKRSKAILSEYENKLGLVKTYLKLKKKTDRLLKMIRSINHVKLDKGDREKLLCIESGLSQLLEQSILNEPED